MSEYCLDARGLLCPMPVIKTQDRVGELQTGDILQVLCTDPGAINDVGAWCRINGHILISSSDDQGQIELVIEVKR